MTENSGNVKSDAGKAVSDETNQKGVGTLLRESRENKDQTLGEIATILRIRQPYLEALEEGRFSDLPGQTYAIGFIRGYAEFLGLDGAEVVRRFKNEVMPVAVSSHLRFPTPLAETGVPSGTLIFVGVIAIVLSYGAWLLNTTEDGFFSDLVSPLPEQFASVLSEEGKFSDINETKTVIDRGHEKTNTISTSSEAKEGVKPEISAATNIIEPESVDQSPESAIEPNGEQASERKLNSGFKSPSISPSQSLAHPIEAGNNQVNVTLGSSDLPKKNIEAVSAISNRPNETVNAAEGSTVPGASEFPASVLTSEKPPIPPGTLFDMEASSGVSPVSDTSSDTLTSSEPPSVPELAVDTLTSPEVSAQVSISLGPETTVAELVPEESPLKSRITVKAIANSWIEIKDDFSNTNLMARLLNKGDTYDVPNQAGLSLHTGNAGALQIIVDGVMVPGIGEVGAVQRGVQLDPDALVAGTAAQ